jgi:hypothetical protein
MDRTTGLQHSAQAACGSARFVLSLLLATAGVAKTLTVKANAAYFPSRITICCSCKACWKMNSIKIQLQFPGMVGANGLEPLTLSV